MGSRIVLGAVGALALGLGCTSSPEPTTKTGASSEPVVLFTSPVKAWTIGVDGDTVFWLSPGVLGGLYSMPKDGGPVTALYEGPTGAAESLGIDATAVYFPSNGSIFSVPRTGGPPRTLASTFSPAVSGVAVGNGQVYWVDRDGATTGFVVGVARSVAVKGGEPISAELPKDVDTSGGSYFTIAAEDGVYASLVPGGGIVRMPFVGAPTLLHVPEARGLASDSESFYFGAKDALDAIPRAGGAIRHLAPTNAAFAVATDEMSVYFTEALSDGRVLKVAKAGGPVTVLAEHQGTPHAIALDATHVYWNCMDDRTIKKIAK